MRRSASSASRCSARPTRSWPRVASRPRSAHVDDRGQLAGPLPRHDGRRQAAEQPADGPAPRPGGAGPRSRAGAWGAVFDRTRDGRILQRPFGGHSYSRLAHVGDRTGLEMIRTLQDRAVADGITVYMECTITHLLSRPDRVKGAFGYWRTTGRPVVFPAKAIVLATGGIGRAYQITLELVGVLGRRPGAGVSRRRRAHRHGVRPVPPDRHGVAAGRPRPARHRGGPRRGRDPPQQGRRTVHVEVPPRGPPGRVRRDRRGGGELGRGAERRPATDARRPPELSTRDNVARAIYTEVREGGARRMAASSSTSATCRRITFGASCPRCTSSSRSWPTSTSRRAPWRSARRSTTSWAGSGSTPRPGPRPGPGCSPPGEVAGGMHGANRLGGNSLSDLLVFGQRTGAGAAADAATQTDVAYVDPSAVQAAAAELAAPLEQGPGEDPYRLHEELQSSHAVACRHLPDRDGPRRGDRPARRASGTLAVDPSHRRSRIQPGLGARLRGPQHADRVRGDRPQRQTASREPRCTQPARLSRTRREVGPAEQRRPPRRRRR